MEDLYPMCSCGSYLCEGGCGNERCPICERAGCVCDECEECVEYVKYLGDLDPCASCGEHVPDFECGSSKRFCGHHCNHSWEHDECCWCGLVFGPDTGELDP